MVRLRAGDIDSEQMIIRVVQSKGRKDRHVMLPDEVLDLLRQWWKVRPREHDAPVNRRLRTSPITPGQLSAQCQKRLYDHRRLDG